MNTLKKVLVLAGPTASGKTALSLRVAKVLDGEIVSADSMQVYRGMDIGTAKPTDAERARVPHHLIDILDPDEPCSAADYGDEAARGYGVLELHENDLSHYNYKTVKISNC